MTLLELTGFYTALLAYEYRGLPNASRQMQLYSKQYVADFFAAELLACYDIDLAVGAQLDVLGKYVGVSRNIGVVIDRPYFGFWSYGSARDPALYQATWNPVTDSPALPTAAGGNTGWWYVASVAGTSASPIVATWQIGDIVFSDGSVWAQETADNGNGFQTYLDPVVNQNGYFYSYNFYGTLNSALSDADYRTVLKLKIILNSNDSTLASIDAYLQGFFPGQIQVNDAGVMHLNYFVQSTISLAPSVLALFLPKPMGVGITVTVVTPAPAPGAGVLTTESGDILTTEDGLGFSLEP